MRFFKNWWFITITCAILLALLLAWGLPIFVAFLRPIWVRILCIVLVFGGWGLLAFLRRRKAKKASDALAAELAGPNAVDEESRVLGQRMSEAVTQLKGAAGKRRDYLYTRPWYVIIGPPGSGKTTALLHSGLRFPFSDQAVKGLGGTRNLDFWFADEAAMVDTAGRYTTQDSDASLDKKSWLSFLNLLKTNRPRQPINGVLVAISIDDLLRASPAEVQAHADAVRKRLMELHEELKIDFPVYAVFTKADLLAGFMEYFADLDENRRQMVWGATFQTKDRNANKVSEVGAEMDLLVERLNERLPERLQDEPDLRSRAVLFGFPAQVSALKRPVIDFLTRVFEPTRYHANATLRGFYFTSGTQEGTPFDQVIGALARSYGVESAVAPAFSGQGKSFFLKDMLEKVVFSEAGWVSTNLAAVRRAFILRTVGYTAVALLTVAIAGLWWTSYQRNMETIEQTERAIATYRQAAGPLLEEQEIADPNLQPVYERVHGLLYLPTGYATRDDATPLMETFGLSQRSRLESASEEAYHAALERLFRPRLILRLEQQIEANLNDPNFVYEALKVYLMLGGKAPLDPELIMAWHQRDWEQNVFPGAAFAEGRQILLGHLEAMMDLDNGSEPLLSLNGPLVEEAQRSLARLSVAERAYALLRSQSRALPLEDWSPAARGGPDVSFVFETVDGAELESVIVPAFYTYNGFHQGLLDNIMGVADQLESERWILGTAGAQSAVDEQYASVVPDVLRLYTADFTAIWQAALNNLRFRSMTADKPQYLVLNAASAPTSPIRQLFESVRDETAVTRERDTTLEEEPEGGAADAALEGLARIGARQFGRVGRAGLDMALGSQQRPGERPLVPGEDIEAYFRPLHVLVDGDPGGRPIDSLIANLAEIYDNLTLAAANPTQTQAAISALQVQVATLRSNASRLPAPVNGMVQATADDIEGDATGTSVAQLARLLADQVTSVCQQTIGNRYPFSSDSDRDVPIADFGRLFAPNGIIDRFFFTNLAALVDTSGETWTWRQDVRLSQDMSEATLRHFQAAAQIRDAFFPSGGGQPQVAVTAQGGTLSGQAEAAVLTVGGTSIINAHGPNIPGTLQWPITGGLTDTAIAILPELPDRRSSMQRTGPWSLFRLIDAGSPLRRGDGVSTSFVIGGREVSFQFQVSSLVNPLGLPALREFRCPSGL
jgi:type VI secretion system protein ImpL